MLLTDGERKRFIEYLTTDINSDEAIITQMIGMFGSDFILVRDKRLDMAVKKRMREMLTLVESQTIGG